MRKLLAFTATALLFAPFTTYAGEWSGTLVDTRCMAMSNKNVGNDHKGGALKGCATACAKMGIPVALYIDGKMHTLAAPAPLLANYMGKNATVSGKEIGGDLILPEKVVVDGKEVNLKAMM
jgi:hypothetical protein